jgi:SOS response regulatory protein OraA/RecX
MLLTEWNWDDAFTIQREEGREEGQNAVLELVRQGFSAEQIEAKLAAIKSERNENCCQPAGPLDYF